MGRSYSPWMMDSVEFTASDVLPFCTAAIPLPVPEKQLSVLGTKIVIDQYCVTRK